MELAYGSRYAVSGSLLPASLLDEACTLAAMSCCAVVFCSAGIGSLLFICSPPGGNHSFKFGADLRYGLNHLVGLDNNNVRSGNFHFAQSRTSGVIDAATGSTSSGLGFATFLLGDPTAFQRTQTQNTNAQERQKRLFFYGQDQWRATSRLTLNYGLRWELYFPETVNGRGQGGLLDLNTGNVRIAGYGNYGTNLNVAKSYTNLAPRIGFAYQAAKSTVVRAGYGRVYGQGWSDDTFGEVLTFPLSGADLTEPQRSHELCCASIHAGPGAATLYLRPHPGGRQLSVA
jgi:outer membrane receptor protein involved in Fe transport